MLAVFYFSLKIFFNKLKKLHKDILTYKAFSKFLCSLSYTFFLFQV